MTTKGIKMTIIELINSHIKDIEREIERYEEQVKTIEKKLKALEIIKEKKC